MNETFLIGIGMILGWILKHEYEEGKSVFKRRTRKTEQR